MKNTRANKRRFGFAETLALTMLLALAIIAGGIGATLQVDASGYREVEYEVLPEVRIEDGYETWTSDYRIVQVEDSGALGGFDSEGYYTAYHVEDGYMLGDLVRTTIIYDHNSPADDAIVAVISYVIERG